MMALEEKFDLQLDEEGEAFMALQPRKCTVPFVLPACWRHAKHQCCSDGQACAQVQYSRCAHSPMMCNTTPKYHVLWCAYTLCLVLRRCREDLHSAGGC